MCLNFYCVVFLQYFPSSSQPYRQWRHFRLSRTAAVNSLQPQICLWTPQSPFMLNIRSILLGMTLRSVNLHQSGWQNSFLYFWYWSQTTELMEQITGQCSFLSAQPLQGAPQFCYFCVCNLNLTILHGQLDNIYLYQTCHLFSKITLIQSKVV